MNKRLLKRHKRQVLRAKQRHAESEPDVRTPEQLKAAREASGSAAFRRINPHAYYATPSTRNQAGPAADGFVKAEV